MKLSNNISDELHRKAIKHFKTRRVITKETDDIWGMDIADMTEWKDSNQGNKYILTIIDTFSKYAWAEPLKTKGAVEVLAAFRKVIRESKRKPKKLWVDQGTEFYNKEMSKYLKENNIDMYSSFGDSKSAIVERFNRTLKTWMWKYFTAKNTREWVNILDELLKFYNKKVHRSIKMSPIEASKPENHFITYENLYGTFLRDLETATKKSRPKFAVGDNVRISRIKDTFEKGFHANWTRETFKVSAVKHTIPVTYEITEWDGTPVKGAFYEQQLQKTEETEFYEVEKVLQVDKRKKMALVKWLGWPEKYNSWVPEKDVKDL